MTDEKIPPNNNEDPDLRDTNRELEEKIRQLEEEKNKLSKRIENLEKENEIFRKETDRYKKENEIFRKELQAKGADIEELLKQNKDLKFRVNMNSSNSSKPPASDGLRKVIHKSLRKSSGKKSGGQPGHAGHSMTVPHRPDETIEYLPVKCRDCPNIDTCKSLGKLSSSEDRYSVDVRFQICVSDHRTFKAEGCPLGHDDVAVFPENVKAFVQYGDTVTELAGILNTYGAMSISRIRCLFNEVLGLPISEGTIISMVRRCADKVEPAMEKIRDKLKDSKVVHYDESGLRVDKHLGWVHNASNDKYTYQIIHEKRGFEGMKAAGIIEQFKGVAVHDCWLPYWSFDSMSHATCGTHFLRELNAIEELEPDHQWVKRFRELLLSMKRSKDLTLSIGEGQVDPGRIETYMGIYDDIMRQADRECPPPKETPGKRRPARGKERALIERFQDLKQDVCRFVYDIDVPFTNNQAEQDIRNVKVKGKVSGCFRTTEGASIYLSLMSFISTARKHGVTSYAALKAAFDGDYSMVIRDSD